MQQQSLSQVSEPLPPPYPPPLLSEADLLKLLQHGHVSIELPHHLGDEYKGLLGTFSDIFAHSIETKRCHFPSPGGVEHGYTLVEKEKEFFTFRAEVESALLSETDSGLLRKIWHDTALLLYRVLTDVARVLAIPYDAFHPLLDGCLNLPSSLNDATPSLLRIFNYFSLAGFADKHCDLGLLTLCIGAGRGLQLWQQEEGWIDAGEVTLLAGDSLHFLSSRRVKSGLHRVVSNPLGRRSIVFALRPSTKPVIDLEHFGGLGYADMKEFWDLLRKRRYNVNEQKEVRERQQLHQKTMANELAAQRERDRHDRVD